MSTSSKNYTESDNSRLDLPVFAVPTELIFASSKRRSLLTIFNPYDNEAQFRIMTTSPDIFDVNLTRGLIKPNRRIDISIRLVSHKIDELPDPIEEPQTIGSFRVVLQIGSIKGSKSIRVLWCLSDEALDNEESRVSLSSSEDRTSKLRSRAQKSPLIQSTVSTNLPSSSQNKSISTQRTQTTRTSKQIASTECPHSGSNVNLVCTICAIACVITLFLPLAIDSELCKKVKHFQDQSNANTGLLSQIANLLSVSYEMKLGCSFALGLFTYRLISTLPD